MLPLIQDSFLMDLPVQGPDGTLTRPTLTITSDAASGFVIGFELALGEKPDDVTGTDA